MRSPYINTSDFGRIVPDIMPFQSPFPTFVTESIQ
jgi:hypothetical protein